jgi:hypothetical protein
MTLRRPWCALARHLWRTCAISSALIASIAVSRAQDPFEIHVLEYEDLQPGDFTFETHLNYVGKGTTAYQGALAPTQDQLHLTYELTGAVTHYASLGVMQLNGKLPGRALETVGWRLVPHIYVPRSWHWPVNIGLVAEFSFEKDAWSEDSPSVEILPIIEKHFGRTEIDLNPTFGRSLHGPDISRGWDFGLAARLGYRATKRFTPSLEYYSNWGILPAFAPVTRQANQIVPGGDFRLGRNVIWNVGIGFGTTPAGDRLVYKTRLEISFDVKSIGHRSRQLTPQLVKAE